MTPQDFIAKWQRANLSERSACQQHFLDLCEVLGQPKPAAADPDGAWYTFERGVSKTTGGQGWADVWMRNHFGWEYKGKHKNLIDAYNQLLQYRESLENPPLLVVCDLDRFEIHTNFTRTAKKVYAFDLAGLADPANLDTLRKVFTDPDALRPGLTTESMTKQAAERFGLLADGMRVRGVPAEEAAHFLMKLMFCMFAEDIKLLPSKLFSKVLEGSKADPPRLAARMKALFEAMATGGDFGADTILYFNGGLFADAEVIELVPDEIAELIRVNEHDWADVEPSIFGTLFERTLDPAKRSQIGAHYTSREDILTLLEPVVMTPLRCQWNEVRTLCEEKYWPKIQEQAKKTKEQSIVQQKQISAKRSKVKKDLERALIDFDEQLAHLSILDPACGSGNFLYVAINLLLDLEKEVIAYAAMRDVGLLPHVRPTQLHGLEINPYAQQLAQVVIWIGYLQWMHHNGFTTPRHPVLEPIESIQQMDAILDLSDPENPKEPVWPKADFIIGNPPFLGDKLMRGELGSSYVESVRALYEDRMPGQSDLCCYWFEKARYQVEKGFTERVGLLATQGIRGGGNRVVLDRIKETGEIFWAESDRNWILNGATVHVSMIGFDNGNSDGHRILDGRQVPMINPNLSAGADTTHSKVLKSNEGVSYLGSCKGGPFDIPEDEALSLLSAGGNPNQRPNSDVVRPTQNSRDILQSGTLRWIIDNADLSLEDACLYELPQKIVVDRVKPKRDENRDDWLRNNWWRPQRMRPAMRLSIAPLKRFVVTTTTSKHRIFIWLQAPTLPDHQLIVFGRDDDFFFGVLHSRIHECWSRALGTQLREAESGFRYTPTTCFETFPFPEPTNAQRETIGTAAAELDRLRNNWLNPPEWTRTEVLEFPGSTDGPWARYIHEPNAAGIGTVRYPRTVPRDEACAKQLQKRTLTQLYNERPTWLDHAHRRLDEAVFAAYGWSPELTDDELLAHLLELNLARASAESV